MTVEDKSFRLFTHYYWGIGVAKRNPKDKHNPSIQSDVMISNALNDIAVQIINDGNERHLLPRKG
jgi:hypothetical protein